MQPAEKLSSDKNTSILRLLREDYLKKVNIKILRPSGQEQYVHLGCTQRAKVKASLEKARARVIHERCFVPPESRGKRHIFQSQKPQQNDVGTQTKCSVTEKQSHLPDGDGSTVGKRCIPSELRRQYLLTKRHPSWAAVRFASETTLNKERINRKYASSSVKTRAQCGPIRDCLKKLWERDECCCINVGKLCGVCEDPKQTPMHETVDYISKSDFTRRLPTFPAANHGAAAAAAAAEIRRSDAANAAICISLEGNHFGAVDYQSHDASCPLARSPERHNHLQAADSPTQQREQHDLTGDYMVQGKQIQTDVAQAETHPRQKQKLVCVYQDGDAFVIRPLSAMKDSKICINSADGDPHVSAAHN